MPRDIKLVAPPRAGVDTNHIVTICLVSQLDRGGRIRARSEHGRRRRREGESSMPRSRGWPVASSACPCLQWRARRACRCRRSNRHFATKRDLLAAVYRHLVRRAGLDDLVAPRSVDEFRELVRAIFDRTESFDDLAPAAMASPAADEGRRLSMPERFEMSRRFADSVVPGLPEVDRDRLARLLVVLTTSS